MIGLATPLRVRLRHPGDCRANVETVSHRVRHQPVEVGRTEALPPLRPERHGRGGIGGGGAEAGRDVRTRSDIGGTDPASGQQQRGGDACGGDGCATPHRARPAPCPTAFAEKPGTASVAPIIVNTI